MKRIFTVLALAATMALGAAKKKPPPTGFMSFRSPAARIANTLRNISAAITGIMTLNG